MTDWTANADGRSNSSELFESLCEVVEDLIRHDAHKLIAGRADMTARLIMANLAHEHGLRPPEHTLAHKPPGGGGGHSPGVGWMCEGCLWRYSYDVPFEEAHRVWLEDARHVA